MNTIQARLQEELDNIKATGLYKQERIIQSQQSAEINVNDKTVLNFCSNNYLGLANHPKLIEAAQEGVKKWGFGLSSVRFICGTQNIHKNLEGKISDKTGERYDEVTIHGFSSFQESKDKDYSQHYYPISNVPKHMHSAFKRHANHEHDVDTEKRVIDKMLKLGLVRKLT